VCEDVPEFDFSKTSTTKTLDTFDFPGQTVAFCRFEDAVQEIFAVEVLLGSQFPDLVNHDVELIGRSYVLGDAALAEVPENLRADGSGSR